MKSILFEIIINNQCNKRCQYCDLDFKSKSLSYKNIDYFTFFLNNNFDKVAYYHINFFGGEPLLSFDKIEYFVKNISIKNIKYSIGTNGFFLDENKLKFFRKNNFNVYLSIDNIDGEKILERDLLADYKDIISINFIIDPDFIYNSKNIINLIYKKGFKDINFMPVFTTKSWTKEAFYELIKLKKYVLIFKDLNLTFFSYFNGISSDLQFILDSSMNLYRDIDSLLWLQKQYKILPITLRTKIEKDSLVGNFLINNLNIGYLIKSYKIEEIIKLILDIPYIINRQNQNLIIDKIMKYEK